MLQSSADDFFEYEDNTAAKPEDVSAKVIIERLS